MKRYASTVWNGTGKEGSGQITTQSTVLNNTQFSYKSRFEDGIGTNPEELIAGAHSGCYTMKLTFVLAGAGFPPEQITTKCDITLDNGVITKSELNVTGKVPGITAEQFNTLAEEAKTGCLVTKLLNCESTVTATLQS
jgi:osmotically inducible protein OsmC